MKFLNYFTKKTYSILDDLENEAFNNFDKDRWSVSYDNPKITIVHTGSGTHIVKKKKRVEMYCGNIIFDENNLSMREYRQLKKIADKVYLDFSEIKTLWNDIYKDEWVCTSNNSRYKNNTKKLSISTEENNGKITLVLENKSCRYYRVNLPLSYQWSLQHLYNKIKSDKQLEQKINEELVFLKLGSFPTNESKNEIMQFITSKNVTSLKKLSDDDLAYIKLRLG